MNIIHVFTFENTNQILCTIHAMVNKLEIHPITFLKLQFDEGNMYLECSMHGSYIE